MKKKNNSQRGMALIMTLWLVIILAVMVFELVNLVRVESNVVINFKEDAQGYSLAEAGIIQGINSLLNDKSKDYDSLDDDWAQEISQELETGSFTVKIVDEQRKININEIDSAILKEFLKLWTPLKNDELTESINDFKDANLKKWDGSIEDEGNKNLLFDTIEELQLVVARQASPGIDLEEENLFSRLKNYITVTGKINLNMVDNKTLATLMFEAGTYTELSNPELEKTLEEYEKMADKAIDFRKVSRGIDPKKPKKQGERAFTVNNTSTRLISALGEEYYERIEPYITWLGKINVNTAPKEVLSAFFLGILGADSGHFADEIISARNNSPFKTYQGLDEITDFTTINTANDYLPVREYLTVKSAYFTIEAIGRPRESSLTKKITAIVEREESGGRFQVKILSWHSE
ncbi:MAG: type II secretion system protein GspK [bacterium]|nr:type II secretion system protein GspK [bacterium]